MTAVIEKAAQAAMKVYAEYALPTFGGIAPDYVCDVDRLAITAALETTLEPSDEEIEAAVTASLFHERTLEENMRAALRAAALFRLGRTE